MRENLDELVNRFNNYVAHTVDQCSGCAVYDYQEREIIFHFHDRAAAHQFALQKSTEQESLNPRMENNDFSVVLHY